jgi:hypothetical protein
MKFEDGNADDRKMRQRVLKALLDIDHAVQSRHVREFEVVRTVNRKGCRYEQDFTAVGQYSGDPKTLIRVVFEVPDDVRPDYHDDARPDFFKSLVADITKIEADGIRAAKLAKLSEAKERAVAAQAEYDRLEQELGE